MPERNSHFDAIVIGSGAGGSAAAYKLATAGLRVAIVEKGERLPRDSSTLDIDRVVHKGEFLSKEPWRDGRGNAFVPEEHFNVGGKTKWYGAALLRYGRHEFDADPAHQCFSWPFGYDELAPYYDEAESLLGLREFDPENDLKRISTRLTPDWVAMPLPLALAPTILTHPDEAARFDGFASVANLKGDAETGFLSRLCGLPNVSMLTGKAVTELLPHPQSAQRIAGVRLEDGRTLSAHAVLLAAGALHSPRLLQRYVARNDLSERIQSADAIGRFLKLHLLTAVVAISASRKTDVIRKTQLFLNRRFPHSSIQPLGFDAQLIGTLVPRIVPRWLARQIGQRAYGFFLQTEDGAHRDNRVYDAGVGMSPVLDYDPDRLTPAAREHGLLVSQFQRALLRAGLVAFSKRIGLAGTAHVSGTLVTGRDPASSVVDALGRVHGLESLYVADGSVLPRSSRVNPSLTIYAWGLRVAEKLAERLRNASATMLETAP
jgi:choline dehydrogenase-like flavoprotein